MNRANPHLSNSLIKNSIGVIFISRDVEWKTISGFKHVIDDLYSVSNTGEVRHNPSGKILHKKIAMKKIHPYYAVYLKSDRGVEWVLVHQLVATFFIPIPKRYLETGVELVPDHLDNDGLNNHVSNLEWKTRGENVSDAFKKGYINKSGEKTSFALISDSQAHKVCEMLEDGKSYDEIIRDMNFPETFKYRRLLVRIKNRLAWNEISKNYSFDSSEYKYSDASADSRNNLSKIRELINEGRSNAEIVDIVWPNTTKRKSKLETIRNIRHGKIYQGIK